MPWFLKMPALVPSCVIAVSQLPRCPMVSFSTSSARAGSVDAMTAAAARKARRVVRFMFSPGLLRLSDRAQSAEPADQGVGADGEHEQHDQQAYMRGMSNRL